MSARPADTYRANGHRAPAIKRPRQFDRATLRGLLRSRDRSAAGRWPGIGDPRARRALAAITADATPC